MTMRAKIARAIEDSLNLMISDAIRNAGEGTGPYPSDWIDAADAVLDAMRDPTEGMTEAGMNAGPELDGDFFESETTAVWQAMIDEVLNEEPTP